MNQNGFRIFTDNFQGEAFLNRMIFINIDRAQAVRGSEKES